MDRPSRPGPLETERLRLRPFTLDDLDAHLRIYRKPEVTWFLAGGPFIGEQARERSRAAVDMFIAHWEHHGFGVWAVTDKETGELIGQCGLKYLPDSPEVEILYALDMPYWGRGLATEAARAALGHGFEAVNLDRVVAVAKPENAASRRIMEKLGMRYEKDVVIFGIRAVYYAIDRPRLSRNARSAGGKS